MLQVVVGLLNRSVEVYDRKHFHSRLDEFSMPSQLCSLKGLFHKNLAFSFKEQFQRYCYKT
jgi:hypothetical protein